MDDTTLTMSVAEAAKRLGVTPDWLRRRAASGIVPSRKMGVYRRFTEQDLLDYLEAVRQIPASTAAGTPLSRARRRRAS